MKWRSWLLLALAAVIHLVMLVSWRWQMPLVPYFFDATVLSGGRGLDFYSIYQAGYNARHGADVYEGDPAKVAVVVPYFTPYRYLPVVAYTAGAALSLWPPLTAYKIWVVVIELTLLLCVFITYRRVRDPRRSSERSDGDDLFARLAVMWLCFTPYYLELFMGQFSLVQGALVFGMLIFAADAERAKGAEKAQTDSAMTFDVLWLTSVLWKINTLIFAPALLRLRRFRILVVTPLVVAVTTIPYFLIFPAHLRDFLVNNFGNSVTGHELGNLGFRQLVFELLAAAGAPPSLQRLAQFGVVAIVLGLSLIVTFYSPRRPSRLVSDNRGLGLSNAQLPLTSYLSLWLTAFFLLSPQIWEHHTVMLLPVLVWTYWQKPGWFVYLVWLLLALPTPFGFVGLQPVVAANHDLRAFPLEPVWALLWQHASKAAPTLGLFLYLALGFKHQPAR